MNSDSFHRLVKSLVDSGEQGTIEEAERQFSSYGVRVDIDSAASQDPTLQLIALTVINVASRSFRGNVSITFKCDFEMMIGPFKGRSFASVLQHFDLQLETSSKECFWPCIYVSNSTDASHSTAIHPWAYGWQYGVGSCPKNNGAFFAPAAVAAAGLAVSEAFSMLRGDNVYAGHRNLALSLWSVGATADAALAPEVVSPLSDLWVIGLGHLGQAYCWTLGFMEQLHGRTVFLQDVDQVTKSTLSTSVLSSVADVGVLKTRVVAKWLESCGIQTALIERRFNENQRVAPSEPGTALFGVDNAAARRVLEGAGFKLAVDAGLGSGYQDFRGLRIRTFPGPSRAEDIWTDQLYDANVITAPAYKALLAEGADPCGVTQLASRSVGASFVGCVAAAYVVAEVCRARSGEKVNGVIDMNLKNPAVIDVV